MHILVTGCAGFIGFHAVHALLKEGIDVTGIDQLTDYYQVSLKQDRLAILKKQNRFDFHQLDFASPDFLQSHIATKHYDYILHLGAQAGVRYSLENPMAYVHANLVGHMHMLELARRQKALKHFIYASSSSVYGGNTATPFAEEQKTDTPVSLYAATKKSDELLSQSYASLYGIKQTGLRFFTVYGPWGRPDMAPWLFTDAILQDRPITVFNNGIMGRDFLANE